MEQLPPMINPHWPCWTAPWPSGTCSGATIPDTWPSIWSDNASRPLWPVCGLRPPTGVRWRWPPTPPGPRTTEGAGAVRLMLCGQDDADCNRLCSARHSDPDVLRRRRRLRRPRTVRAATGPGRRSPLYQSSHLAARFALGLATGQEGATSTTSTAAPRSPASRSPTGWPRTLNYWRSAMPCWSSSASWVWAIRCHLRGPRAGGDLRPRPGGVPPPDPHAPGTARPAHHRISQGIFQALALGLAIPCHPTTLTGFLPARRRTPANYLPSSVR